MTGLVLYHRPGCHLCEQMLASIYGTYGDEIEVELINVDSDPRLKERFGDRIPVLTADGKVVCEGRLDVPALDAFFHGLAGIS